MNRWPIATYTMFIPTLHLMQPPSHHKMFYKRSSCRNESGCMIWFGSLCSCKVIKLLEILEIYDLSLSLWWLNRKLLVLLYISTVIRNTNIKKLLQRMFVPIVFAYLFTSVKIYRYPCKKQEEAAGLKKKTEQWGVKINKGILVKDLIKSGFISFFFAYRFRNTFKYFPFWSFWSHFLSWIMFQEVQRALHTKILLRDAVLIMKQ